MTERRRLKILAERLMEAFEEAEGQKMTYGVGYIRITGTEIECIPTMDIYEELAGDNEGIEL